KKSHQDEVSSLRKALDNISASQAAAELGAGVTATTTAETTKFRAGLAGFVRTGSMEQIHAAMNVGSQPDGGYLVAPALSNQINQKVWDVSPIARLARHETI